LADLDRLSTFSKFIDRLLSGPTGRARMTEPGARLGH